MSLGGNCWYNDPQESFFGHMKYEIEYRKFSTLNKFKQLSNNYISY